MKINISSDHFLQKSGIKDLIKIMKLCLLFLFAFTFQLVALDGKAQDAVIELKKNSVTVNELINEIEKQTEYLVVYSNREVNTNRKVNFHQNSDKVSSYLDKAFSNTDIGYNFEKDYIVLSKRVHRNASIIAEKIQTIQQRGRTIRGNVVDTNKEPVIGATIVVQGKSMKGTVTDINGQFTLSNLEDDENVLVVSFVGMKSEQISIDGKSLIEVVLQEDAIGLEEFVAIGYGSMKKSDLTGAIAQINPANMEGKITSNMTDLLRSSIAGLYIPLSVDPKGGVNMNNALIRGSTSLLASNKPLIVLDGMVYDGDLANISPSDIERVDVLKDASSAAIYGSRAANGVIIITTKQGARGEPSINISINTGLSTPSFLRKVYDADGYLNMRQMWSEVNLPREELAYYNNPSNLPPSVSLDQWMAYGNATGNPVDVWLARIGLFQTEINNYNKGRVTKWNDLLFQTGLRQDYRLSINGGNEKFRYYWSANYTDNEGFAVGQSYNSIRSRVNLESEIASFLTIGMNTQFALRDESSIPVNLGYYPWLSPYGSMYEEDGKTLKFQTHDFNISYNPFYDREYINRYNKIQDLDSKLYATLRLPAGFSYQINFINSLSGTRFYQHESAQSDANSNGGEANRINTTYSKWIIDNILKWNKSIGRHSFDLTLLANAEKQNSWRDEMVNSQFFPSDVLGYHGMQIGQNSRVNSDDQVYTRDALLGRLNYTLASKYLLTAAIRRDGYSAFGQNNPYACFPTFATGWIITEEKFFNVKPIDFLKLRFSWGENGNSSIGSYSALATMESRKFLHSIDGTPITVSELRLARMANTGLQWEKTSAYNIGIDFGFFGNKINGTLEGYLSETTNLLVDRKLPSVTGYGSVAANLGKIDNRGVELTLNTINLEVGRKFSWRSHFNASMNRNKIVSLYGDYVDILDENGRVIRREEASDYENGWFIGQPIDVIWDYASNGIWQIEEADAAKSYGGYFPGQFKNVDVNGDGKFNSDDKQFIGNSTPQFRWNLSNNFEILENISFSFSLYGHHGHIANFTESARSALHETGNGYDMPYWTPENRSNKYPGMQGVGGTNFLSLSFVRLNDVSIGYTFPDRIASQLFLRSLKISGTVNNACMWTKWPGWDPENATGPVPRYFNLSINVGL